MLLAQNITARVLSIMTTNHQYLQMFLLQILIVVLKALLLWQAIMPINSRQNFQNWARKPVIHQSMVSKPQPGSMHFHEGGLVQPSKSFLSQLKEFEIEFSKFHGNKINPCKNVISTFTAILASKFSNVPLPIIKKYARTRTFFRIRHLNKEINAENFNKRKEKQLKQFQN